MPAEELLQTYFVKPHGGHKCLFPYRELAEAERRSLLEEFPDEDVEIEPGPQMTVAEYEALPEHPGY